LTRVPSAHVLHHEYPPSIRDHVANRLQHLVRFFEGTVSVRAVLEREHDDHKVELIASVRHGIVLVVEARRDSITTALDEAVERMGRALARHKAKLLETRRKGRER
jgi:ribosomal subunit interface protein